MLQITRSSQPTLLPSSQQSRRRCHPIQLRRKSDSSRTEQSPQTRLGGDAGIQEGGVSNNFRDALDLKFYSALEHADHGYINVLPREYIVHFETDHCPID